MKTKMTEVDVLIGVKDKLLSEFNWDADFTTSKDGVAHMEVDDYAIDYDINTGEFTIDKFIPIVDTYTGQVVNKEEENLLATEILDATTSELSELMEDMVQVIIDSPVQIGTESYVDEELYIDDSY